jgi:hypothetical protein
MVRSLLLALAESMTVVSTVYAGNYLEESAKAKAAISASLTYSTLAVLLFFLSKIVNVEN